MAFTTADMETLERAIAAGAQQVQFADGRRVTYFSADEMRRARDAMRMEIEAEAASSPRRVTRVVYSRT